MYESKHFKASELLPHGYSDISVMDPLLLETIDEAREILGVPCTVNADGRQFCGWRPQNCSVGAPKSQHKLGKAADLHPKGMTAEEARKKIREAVAQGKLRHLGGMELDVSWLHLDVRPRVGGKVLEFRQ